VRGQRRQQPIFDRFQVQRAVSWRLHAGRVARGPADRPGNRAGALRRGSMNSRRRTGWSNHRYHTRDEWPMRIPSSPSHSTGCGVRTYHGRQRVRRVARSLALTRDGRGVQASRRPSRRLIPKRHPWSRRRAHVASILRRPLSGVQDTRVANRRAGIKAGAKKIDAVPPHGRSAGTTCKNRRRRFAPAQSAHSHHSLRPLVSTHRDQTGEHSGTARVTPRPAAEIRRDAPTGPVRSCWP
jgi:hypothetical protein